MTQQATDSSRVPSSNIRTPLCERLGIDLPIISAGMGPISGPTLAAAVSNAGGLGVMGCTTMAPEEIRTYIKRCRELTDKPFGVDLILPARLDQSGARVSDVASHIPDEHRALAEHIAQQHGIEHAASNAKGPTDDRMALGTDSEAQIEVILDEKVPVFVGALGSPGWMVDRAHEAGTIVMSMVGNVKQASGWRRTAPMLWSLRARRAAATPATWARWRCCLKSWTPFRPRRSSLPEASGMGAA